MTLPTGVRPQQGIFVYQRLQAMSKLLFVRALRPQPWFPGIRSGSLDPPVGDAAFPIDSRRMLYLPGIAKWLDGWWMERCTASWLDQMSLDPERAVLDAHFAYPEGVACYRVAKRTGVPYFVTLRGVEEEWLRQPRIRHQIVQALNEATGVIAVSESLRAAAAAAGVDAKRIRIIPNGCDTRTFHPGSKGVARRQLGLDQQKKLLVSVADIRQVKGHDVLVCALEKLKRWMDFELICIGHEDQSGFARRVHERVEQAGLTKSIRFTGPLPPEEVARYLRAADVFVLASRREGCCNAVIEAMACGTPVVATAVGSNTELARCFSGIRLVEPDSPAALSEALGAAFEGHVTMPGSEFRPFEVKSWDEVASDCVSFIRNAVGGDATPAAGAPCWQPVQ